MSTPAFTTRPELRGSFGMVATTHWIGSAVAFGILEKGGNAFDAAVAGGFALQIVEPHLNGPGGEVPILGLPAGQATPFVLCGQGVAPAAATLEAYRGHDIRLVPGTGHLAAVVPGAFDAWMLLLRDHGTLPLREVLAPAIAYAESGFPIVPRAVAAVASIADHFREHWRHSAEVWLPGGRLPTPGGLHRNPGIAAAYGRILKEADAAGPDREAQIEAARRAWSQGFVAEAVDAFMREPMMDGTGRANAGYLTGQDMADWQASYEAPLSLDHGGITLHKCGAWSQGPAHLQALKILEGMDLAAMDPLGPDWVHAIAEALKLALADRDAWYADPDFADVPMERLLSDAYADERRKLIGERASHELRPGHAGGDPAPALAALLELAGCETPQGAGSGEPTFADLPEVEGDTVHIDVVDRWGNMVSATPSGGWLQSSPAVPGLGFALSTRAQMFWLDERLPSVIAPGKRPRTTLTPSLATRDGEGWLAFGTPGGDQQDQWQLALLMRLLHQGAGDLQAAIDAPLFHTAHYAASFYPRAFAPGKLLIEDRFPQATLEALRDRGHDLSVQDSWAVGRLCAAGRMRSGLLRAAATPRFMQAYAVGR